MRFINMEAILPKIRDMQADLTAAQQRVLAEADARRRAILINRNRARWTAVRDAYEEASHGKCWYTECRSPGADNDIDHFRPKLGVTEDVNHPGYYWLAFDWRNFRLSCQRANRPRRGAGNSRAGGKANHFPLLVAGIRALAPGDDTNLERPALLDPTDPGDPVLLSFKPNGEMDLSPEYRGNAIAEAKIDASRLGLHLNWPKFVEARLTLYNLIERTVERGQREAPADFNGMPTASAAFKDTIRDLHGFMDQREEYSSAARIYVESFKHIWWVRDVVLRLPQ